MALKTSPTHHENGTSQGQSIPSYMMNLYKTINTGNETGLSMLEYPILRESDLVLSLPGKHCTEMDNIWEISFDMTSVEINNELKLAELRILPSFSTEFNNITLNIYDGTNSSEKIFIGSLHSTSTITPDSSWKGYDLTNMIQNYLHHSGTADEASKKVTDTSEDSVNSTCNGILAEKVMLVLFSKDNQSFNSYESKSIIRVVESSKYVKNVEIKKAKTIQRQPRSLDLKQSIIKNSAIYKAGSNEKSLCKKVDMMVDFYKLGWGDQIIYPKRYNAYRCEGPCPIPLNEESRPSNHAYILSLVKHINPEKVEGPACVPTKLRALPMLMYQGAKVILRYQDDMIVEECGCA
ncbi:nodal homolog 2-A-like [Pyxicephalus adspersus]